MFLARAILIGLLNKKVTPVAHLTADNTTAYTDEDKDKISGRSHTEAAILFHSYIINFLPHHPNHDSQDRLTQVSETVSRFLVTPPDGHHSYSTSNYT